MGRALWISTLCGKKSGLKSMNYWMPLNHWLIRGLKSAATRRSGEEMCMKHSTSGGGGKVWKELCVKVHQRASTTEKAPTHPFVSATVCQWSLHCWHKGLKKRVTLGYAWVQQLGLSSPRLFEVLALSKVQSVSNRNQSRVPNMTRLLKESHQPLGGMFSVLYFFHFETIYSD